ncbi:MAG: thioredoxin domain-containing protein [Nitrososphaerales archaeon]
MKLKLSAINVDSENWDLEVNKSEKPVLVEFWHQHCVWCKKLNPIIDELASVFSEKLKVAKINVLSSEKNAQVAEYFGVMGTPTLILFCRGRPIESIVGYRNKETLFMEIQRMIDSYKDCFEKHTPLEKHLPFYG